MTKIKGAIQLLCALGLVALIVWTNIAPREGRSIEDAVYVDDAQVLPENEGKRIIIAGAVRVGAGADDTDLGLSFESPVARRTVEQLAYVSGWKWQTIYDYSTKSDLKEATFAGTASIGQFELDSDLLVRLPYSQRDWQESDVGRDVPAGWRFDRADSMIYLTQAYTFALDEANYDLYSDLEGCYRVRYKLWNTAKDLEATVVGIQRGSTLCYDPDLDAGSTFEGILDADEVVASNNFSMLLGEIIFAGIPAVVLIVLGVLNIRDR